MCVCVSLCVCLPFVDVPPQQSVLSWFVWPASADVRAHVFCMMVCTWEAECIRQKEVTLNNTNNKLNTANSHSNSIVNSTRGRLWTPAYCAITAILQFYWMSHSQSWSQSMSDRTISQMRNFRLCDGCVVNGCITEKLKALTFIHIWHCLNLDFNAVFGCQSVTVTRASEILDFCFGLKTEDFTTFVLWKIRILKHPLHI